MIVPTIWEEILNHLSNMSRDQQLKVLDFARSLTVIARIPNQTFCKNASVSSKRLWQPYFDIEALDKYCN